MTDFLWAVKNGDLGAVQNFVQEGVNLNEEIEGRTPLHYAADYGHSEVIGFLVDKGGQVDIKDKHGITPILAAIWEGHTNSVKILLQKGASKTGSSPDGMSYLECAEKEEIKQLLQ
ncbi:myotrophin-like [Mytilus trossulus]|uniref:myotrophin-like n=1 Tax=Mytilus trossulus TaxID=6551 RepID=UPI0030044620